MQSSVVLVGGGLPSLDPRRATGHYPRTKDENLPYGLVEVAGQWQFCDLLAPLEDPESLRASIARVAPSSKDLLFPSIRCSYIGRSLGTSDEDKVEAALEIVCLERSADGGGYLERCFAEGYRGEGNSGWGDQAYGLSECIVSRSTLAELRAKYEVCRIGSP